MDTSIIAGRNSVTEALKAGRSVTKIYMTAKKEAPPLARIRTLAKERKIPVEFVDTRAMERLAQGVRHQDVIALAAAVDFADLDDVLAKVQEKGEMPFLVLADGLFFRPFIRVHGIENNDRFDSFYFTVTRNRIDQSLTCMFQ